MGNHDDISTFLSKYSSMLKNIFEKTSYFKKAYDTAYAESAQQIPTIKSELLAIINNVKDNISTLGQAELPSDDLSRVKNILSDIENVLPVINDMLNDLQSKKTVDKCISHIERTIFIANEHIADIDSENRSHQTIETVKFLAIMPRLLFAQIDGVYDEMNSYIHTQLDRTTKLSGILTLPLTLESLLAGDTQKSRLTEIIEILSDVEKVSSADSTELKELLKNTISEFELLEPTVFDVLHLLDVSAASTKTLEQPLAEKLFLDNNLSKASIFATKLLKDLSANNTRTIDCDDKVQDILNLLSTDEEKKKAQEILDNIDL